MFRSFVVGSLFVFVCASIACSSSSPGTSSGGTSGTNETNGNGGNCGKPGRAGTTTGTSCGTCSAGQYCETQSTSSGFDECRPGCTSDDNCGETERCVRCGDAEIGSCRSCSETKEEACTKPEAGPVTCTRDTSYDKECEAPGKAFECPDTQSEPTGQGTCVQTNLPQVFCCGGGVASTCQRDTQLDAPLCQGKKAYGCPPNEEPSGTCKLAPDGVTYCCE